MSKILAFFIVAALAFGASADAFAARKKPRPKRPDAPLVQRDYDGTPIIMKGFRPPPATSIMKDEPGTGRLSDQPSKKASGPRPHPRGSSTYIPPPVPSPSARNLPALQSGPGVYQPPKINSFGDRVINCIHSYPLNAGIGNNPTERQAYIRQCAN
jgi:hypothetical protein